LKRRKLLISTVSLEATVNFQIDLKYKNTFLQISSFYFKNKQVRSILHCRLTISRAKCIINNNPSRDIIIIVRKNFSRCTAIEQQACDLVSGSLCASWSLLDFSLQRRISVPYSTEYRSNIINNIVATLQYCRNITTMLYGGGLPGFWRVEYKIKEEKRKRRTYRESFKAFVVAFRRSSSRTLGRSPEGDASSHSHRSTHPVQSPPFSLSFGASSRRARPRTRHLPPSASTRVHCESISRNRCLTPPLPPPPPTGCKHTHLTHTRTSESGSSLGVRGYESRQLFTLFSSSEEKVLFEKETRVSTFHSPLSFPFFLFFFLLQKSGKEPVKLVEPIEREARERRMRYKGGIKATGRGGSWKIELGDGARSIVARVYEARRHFGTSRRARHAGHRHPARVAAGLLPMARASRRERPRSRYAAPRRRHPSRAAAPGVAAHDAVCPRGRTRTRGTTPRRYLVVFMYGKLNFLRYRY